MKHHLLYLASATLIIVQSIQAKVTTHQKKCITPDLQDGYCIDVYGCSTVLDKIKNVPKPISEENKQMIKNYQCDINGKRIKVCCPNRMQDHPNYQLLDHKHCGIYNDDRIIAGNISSLGEFPYVTVLAYHKRAENENAIRCVGMLINDRYVLTSAACTEPTNNVPLKYVRINEFNLKTEEDCETMGFDMKYCLNEMQEIRIAEMIVHDKYNSSTYENNIALIRLAEKVNITQDGMLPICLPVYNTASDKIKNLYTVIGWGLMHDSTKKTELGKTTMRVREKRECARLLDNQYNDVFCMQKTSEIPDLGSPMMQVNYMLMDEYRMIQFGLYSHDFISADDTKVPVYVNIMPYNEWILDNLRP